MSDEEKIIAQHPEWKTIQKDISSKLDEKDRIVSLDEINYIAGLYLYDFNKGVGENCVAVGISVINFYTGKTVYSIAEIYETDIPYITGYIGFREVPLFKKIYEKLLIKHPEYSPHVLVINSYGKLHYTMAGSATQLAIELNIPVIGIGQTILHMDGLSEKDIRTSFKEKCKNTGDFAYIVGDSKTIYGAAVKTSDSSANPIYVTVGNFITLETSINIIINCSHFRMPEPIRKAERETKNKLSIYIKNKKKEEMDNISNSTTDKPNINIL
jgi:endonuclease V